MKYQWKIYKISSAVFIIESPYKYFHHCKSFMEALKLCHKNYSKAKTESKYEYVYHKQIKIAKFVYVYSPRKLPKTVLQEHPEYFV